MHEMVIILAFIILFIYSCVVSYYCYKFAMILIKLEDVVEESLSKLESIRLQFIEILEIPVFFDSVEIRKCVQLIKTAKVVVEETINSISDISSSEEVELNTQEEKLNTGDILKNEREKENFKKEGD